MAMRFQVTFDVADPAGLARSWAEVLGYELEDVAEERPGLVCGQAMTSVSRDTELSFTSSVAPSGFISPHWVRCSSMAVRTRGATGIWEDESRPDGFEPSTSPLSDGREGSDGEDHE